MSYLFLGIALLAGFMLAGRWFVSADPKTLMKVLKWALIGVIVLVALFFLVTGRFAWAIWALPALLPWLLRARQVARTAKNFSRMSGGTSGQASEVKSMFLAMRLDHDSGDMDGRVRQGRHEGRFLSDLSREDLLQLYEDYIGADDESARLLAAYLDRMHPEWRGESHDRAEDHDTEQQASTTGSMSRGEALRVLGLEEGAEASEIREAHHGLIGNLHPDRGGSAYLAAKINEARDVLLKK